MYGNLSELVVIGTVQGELAAHVIKSRLESEGIPVLLQYESVSRIYPITIAGLGEVRILIPQELTDEAKKIIGKQSGFIPIRTKNDELSELKKPSRRPFVIHRAAKPYKSILSDGELKHLRDMLSCPTCRFDNEEALQKGLPWCNAPHPPDIENNYCNTFEQLNK